MPARRHRTSRYGSHSFRAPSGKTAVHYKERKHGVARCSSCGRPLGGVPRSPQFHPRSSRRPNRPFGGQLCPACSRELIKQNARV